MRFLGGRRSDQSHDPATTVIHSNGFRRKGGGFHSKRFTLKGALVHSTP